MRKKAFFIIFFLWLGQAAQGQDYLWPTNASPYLSSSFAEYRPGHYHSAIDIKTWNQEGYPVYAVADGKIIKVRLSPFGYGKVLYLQLDDGRWAVYAHLQKFIPAIEKALRSLQLKLQRYSVTWRPANWRVKKGQVIAYTGQTGIGVPHLHFEIRADEAHPINPLHFYPQVQDHQAPVLSGLMAIPLNDTSSVEQTPEAVVYSLIKKGKNRYALSQPINAWGMIGLALKVFDRADGVYNRLTFYRLELLLNRQRVFSLRYDTLDFNKTRQIDLTVYYPFLREKKGIYNKLYLTQGNQLPWYGSSLHNGIARVTDTLRFTVNVWDFKGNRATLEGVIAPRKPCSVEVDQLLQSNYQYFLRLTLPNPLSVLRLGNGQGGGPRAIERFEIVERAFTPTRQRMLLRIPGGQITSDPFYLQTASRVCRALTAVSGSDSLRYDLRLITDEKGLFARITPAVLSPRLKLYVGEKALPLFSSAKYLWSTLPKPTKKRETFSLLLKNSHHVALDTSFVVYTLTPYTTDSLALFGDSVRLFWQKGDLYKPLYVRTLRRQVDTLTGQALYGFRYQLAPFKHAPVWALKIPSIYRNVFYRQLLLARLSKHGKTSYHYARVDSLKGYLISGLTAHGWFHVTLDTVAPTLKALDFQQGDTLKKMDSFTLRIKDDRSGIASDQNIHIFVDSTWVIPEWDPERHTVTVNPHWRLSPGKHTIEVWVRDRAGNTRRKIYSVYLTGKSR